MNTALINTLDNNNKITSFKHDEFLIWPSLRFIVLQSIIDQSNNLDNAKSSPQVALRLKIIGIFKALFNCPFFGPRKPNLLFNSSTSNIKCENGVYYNRIVDYFYETDINNTWKIEEINGFLKEDNQKYNSYSSLSIKLFIALTVKFKILFFKKELSIAKRTIKQLIDEVNENIQPLGINIQNHRMQVILLKVILGIKPTFKIYKCLFKIKRTKKILIEDGHYGLEKASIIKAAKSCEILVMEPQHGFVNENHPAYSYGDLILSNKEYQTYLPDIFLCYGDFWANSIKIPNKKYIIGNPHLEYSIAKVSETISTKKILVIGSGVTIAETNELLLKLLEITPKNYTLHYRPHPQERSEVENRYLQSINKGVNIDSKPLYDSLAESEVIIGELTTVIFETLALHKPVYLFNSSYTKTYFNERIKYFKFLTLDNLDVIFNTEKPDKQGVEYYWKSGWLKSYRQIDQ